MKTDDVLKAIAICACDQRCSGCPYFNTSHKDCVDALLLDSRDLIKRQKAEIDRLKSKVNRLEQYDEARDIRLHTRLTETARTEAIKEFAERIEPKMANNTDISAIGYQSVIAIIDNLVKEMTEVRHAETD